MKKRRKISIAGDLVKVTIYTPPMPRDGPIQRAAKHKATTAAQKKLNNVTAKERFELKLAANFSPNDYFATLTYKPEREPGKRSQVVKDRQAFIRTLRKQRKMSGRSLKWAASIEHKHGEGHWHIHAVISGSSSSKDIEEIKSLWMTNGHADVWKLFNTSHRFNNWGDVAHYMTKERPDDLSEKDTTPVGSQIYSCSRNLKMPKVITEWVDSDNIEIPKGAHVIDRTSTENQYSHYEYCKYSLSTFSDYEKKIEGWASALLTLKQ